MNKRILFVTGLILSVMLMSGVVMAGPNAQGSAPEADVAATVTVPGYISLTLSNAPTWTNLIPGATERFADNAGSLTIFIGPETNSGVTINTRGQGEFASGTGSVIPLNRMKYERFTEGVASEVAYSIEPGLVRQEEIIDHTAGLTFVTRHKMSVPTGQAASSTGYTTRILITATAYP